MARHSAIVLLLSTCVFVSLLLLWSTSSVGAAPLGNQVFGSFGAPSGSSPSAGTTATSSGGLGGLSNILSDIDLPAILKSVNSLVKVVGIFCPPLSQILDNVIQNVTSTAFRVFGRIILQNGGLGGGGGAGGAGGGQKVSVVLPTFPPDEDYDYDEDEDTKTASSGASSSAGNVAEPDAAAATTATNEAVNEVVKRRAVRAAEPAAADDNNADQDGAESAPQPAEENENVEDEDADDRNKRYSALDGTAGGGGGSGNFLFDLIRLVAGSGATEEQDEAIHGPGGIVEVDINKSGEGIPGPITRLFVIANRGIANLVQELILRAAQTSEKIVNFKARLITALI